MDADWKKYMVSCQKCKIAYSSSLPVDIFQGHIYHSTIFKFCNLRSVDLINRSYEKTEDIFQLIVENNSTVILQKPWKKQNFQHQHTKDTTQKTKDWQHEPHKKPGTTAGALKG